MDDQATAIQATIQPFLAGTLGIRLTSVTKEGVTAELLVRDEICTVPGVCHGGALMAFADQLGAVRQDRSHGSRYVETFATRYRLEC